MKKIKLLMPMATIASAIAVIAPLASCSKTVVEEGIKVTLAPESAQEIKIKETKCELNKDSTITLDVPLYKGAKITYIIVGTTRIEPSAYTFDGETITIKAAAMTAKNVEVFVSASNVVGLTAKVEKTFEALESFKAEDLKVYPVYDDETVSTKALVWNEGYKIYDPLEEEVEDFATTGYTFDRDEAREGSVEFGIEFAPYTRYTTTVKVSVTPRLEPESINVVVDSAVFKGDKLTPSEVNIEALMTDQSKKVLEWGKDYSVWDGDNEITDFGTNGYTFTEQKAKSLIFKAIENPEETEVEVKFNVEPISFKNTVYMINDGKDDATISWTKWSDKNLQYSINNGKFEDVSSPFTYTLKSGDSIAFRGNNPTGFTSFKATNGITVTSSSSSPDVKISGNALGLLDMGVGQAEEKGLAGLFKDSTAITKVSKNFLPSTKLDGSGYKEMFQRCTNLIDAPDLPADNLVEEAYSSMFEECEKLRFAPNLLATHLAKSCYNSMFWGCKNLLEAPTLPAIELNKSCYNSMFYGCSSLVKAPALPATKLQPLCYKSMFQGCTKLATAPTLPAEELNEQCYFLMFAECENLKVAPELPATKLAKGCYKQMFYYCPSLVNAPVLPATTLAQNCYQTMFAWCTSLISVPELPATTLEQYCYSNMFDYCTKLKIRDNDSASASAIKIFTCPKTDPYYCVKEMFKDTDCSFEDDPVEGKTYYYEPQE